MFKKSLTKADGRALHLYGATTRPEAEAAPAPPSGGARDPHLRWHPLRGEWVAYAAHRQHRTFLPPDGYNPLAPMRDPHVPTELPPGRYDMAVFENLFPTFALGAPDVSSAGVVARAPAVGVCEVVVYAQDPDTTLGALPLHQVELLVDIWADRTNELGRLAAVDYVMPFENRGVEVGVTLTHPHGQVYGYPFVPPVAEGELRRQREYLERGDRGLVADLIESELAEEVRVVWHDAHAVAFVPAFARYGYEVWIAPRRAVPSMTGLSGDERASLAKALKCIVATYDALWARPFPYVMVVHQAPTDGHAHPEAHVHLEFYPAYRMRNRLKYLAGSELGAGVFAVDLLPEAGAAELREARVLPE